MTLSNATFNLFPLHLNEFGQLQSYKVKDLRSIDDPDDDYLYEFNVCGAVGSVPKGCDNKTIVQNTYDRKPRMYCEDNDISINETNGRAYCNVEMKSVGDNPGILSTSHNIVSLHIIHNYILAHIRKYT